MLIRDWMTSSGVGFGTSGARGLVTAMTDALCFAYTVGYLRHLQSLGEYQPGMDVAFAGDLRPSTPCILRACAAAIRFMEGVPVFCGYVPTPALCLYAFHAGIPSLMVTGSHIPADRNGIKFNRARGEFLKSDENPMRAQDVALPTGWFDANGTLIRQEDLPPVTDVTRAYIARTLTFFGPDSLTGMTLGVYQHSAVGRDLLVTIIEALGGKAVSLARSDTFQPVDTEAVRPEDVTSAFTWAQNGELDAILTTDGDSDRPLLADETGQWIRGDVLGILAARFLKAASVATPVNSNTALEKSGVAAHVTRTKIGSPYVVAAMTQAHDDGYEPSVGYEANGGFLLASPVTRQGRVLPALPTRDAVLPMICALAAARSVGQTLSELVSTLPPRHTVSDRLSDFPQDRSKAGISAFRENLASGAAQLGLTESCGHIMAVDETDGLRLTFESDDIVHIRPSGNAPELRVYVESATQRRAATILASTLGKIGVWRDH